MAPNLNVPINTIDAVQLNDFFVVNWDRATSRYRYRRIKNLENVHRLKQTNEDNITNTR